MTDCLFCRIVAGEIPSDKVYEDENFLAFRDIAPKAPVHVLILPKKHIKSLEDMEDGDAPLIGGLHLVLREVARQEGIAESGYRVINNCGPDAGQVVFHIHFHLLGGSRQLNLD